ncbi:MAG: O-antigen ligase family protein [Flavobacteriales bacterium]
MISKRKLVNTLFLLSFPLYGIGSYMMLKNGFSEGLMFCALPYLAIIFFYGIDLLYRGSFTPRINGNYWVCLAAIASLMFSVQQGLWNHSPILNPGNRVVLMVLFFVPFHAALIVQLYNRDVDGFDWSWMVVKGLLALVIVNLLGVAAGMHNLLHSFEGRISFPFVMGIYDAAHLLAFLNLMLLFYMGEFKAQPLRSAALVGVYLLNIYVIMSINSRLSFMIFFVFTVLFLTKVMKKARVYTISLFTMPLMMSFALLIYEVLSMPFFVAILSRVDKKDVTTFNGRTYIWESAADWAMKDRRGFVFGNGYNGQYHIHLLERVAKMWNTKGSYNLHMHSAFLEIVVNQGIVGLGLMYVVYWLGYKYYRRQFVLGTAMAPLYAGFIYLLFIWQIDIFGYGIYMGNPLLYILMAPACIAPAFITGRRKAMNGAWLD